MNIQTNPQPQSMSALLASVATVISVKTTALGLSRTDKQASAETERDHNAKSGIARVSVSRLAGAELQIKEIKSLHGEARMVANKWSTIWNDRRLMPNVNIQPYLKDWMAVKQLHDEKVNQLHADAPRLVMEAERNLGDFNIEPPTIEEIREAFSLEFTMEPVPDANNFRNTTLDNNLEAQLRERFEADVAAAYQMAQRDTMQRLSKPLQNLVERMGAYNKREADVASGLDVGREGYFRDSIITNIDEISEVYLRSCVVVEDDPTLVAINNQLQQIKGIEAEDLRKDKALRDDTARRATNILNQLGSAGWL